MKSITIAITEQGKDVYELKTEEIIALTGLDLDSLFEIMQKQQTGEKTIESSEIKLRFEMMPELSSGKHDRGL